MKNNQILINNTQYIIILTMATTTDRFGYSDSKKKMWTQEFDKNGAVKNRMFCDDMQLEKSHKVDSACADFVIYSTILKNTKDSDFTLYNTTEQEFLWLSCRIMEFRRVYLQRLVGCSSYLNDVADLNPWWHENGSRWRMPTTFDWCNTVEFRQLCFDVLNETKEELGKLHEVYNDLPPLSLAFPFCLPRSSWCSYQKDFINMGGYAGAVNDYTHKTIPLHHKVFWHYIASEEQEVANTFCESPLKDSWFAVNQPIEDPHKQLSWDTLKKGLPPSVTGTPE